MKIIKLKNLKEKDLERIVNRSRSKAKRVRNGVQKIVQKVRNIGDLALYKSGGNKYGLDKGISIQVNNSEIRSAFKLVASDYINSLNQMIKNISKIQKSQILSRERPVPTEKGIKVWRVWNPIEKIGLYVPGGKASYPSTVLMNALPAIIAGCKEIILCSPPQNGQSISPYILVAADMVGIKKIYKAGGAEAVSAMAYGTKTIPSVYKIFGPGNLYVTTAKTIVSQDIAIDMPAGPSEVFIIADDTANPKYIAADLIADGEHGEDSACVLITTSEKVARETMSEIRIQLTKLSTAIRVQESIRKYGLIAVVDSLEEAIEFTNRYAPEHLEIMTKNYNAVSRKIVNAGSIFLGNWTCKSSGDYATGANHVLPTGGMAKMYSALGVEAFGKWTEVQECTKNGLRKIRKTIEIMSTEEQLPGHKNSVSIRFKNI